MAETTIHKVCLREEQSGQFQYSFKAEEGFYFTNPPNIRKINGEEWDTENDGPMTITYGNDFAERDGAGSGIKGTETVTITLSYDIPDLDPADDNNNNITIEFTTKRIRVSCAPETEYITFSNPSQREVNYPRINGLIPYAATTAYPGDTSIFMGLVENTYSWYIDDENDAFTIISDQPGITVQAPSGESKNRFVRTAIYEGNVDLYWGNVEVIVTGDFGKASMLFDNGLRNTLRWFRYSPTCSAFSTRTYFDSDYTGTLIQKTGECNFALDQGKRYQIDTGRSLYSTSNGYSFSEENADRAKYNAGGGNYINDTPLEPHTRTYTRENTMLSVYKYGDTMQTKSRISFDSGETFQDCVVQNQNLTGPQAGTDAWVFFKDVAYAGYDDDNSQHVWFAYAGYIMSETYPSGPPWGNTVKQVIYKSVDDGLTWNLTFWNTSGNYINDFQDVPTRADVGYDHIYHGRIWASLKNDYIFLYAPSILLNTSGRFQSALWRAFAVGSSTVGSSPAPGDVRPVLASSEVVDVQGGGTEDYGYEFGSDDILYMSDDNDNRKWCFDIAENGLCVFTNEDEYAVSYNYGLNWAKGTYPTINHTHTNGTSYIYPEYQPSPFYFNGKMYVYTSHTDTSEFNQRNETGDDSLVGGLMTIKIKNEEGWFTSELPSSWDDLRTFGVPTGLTSSIIGPYDSTYAANSIIYGDNILFHVVGNDPNQDPNFSTFYWYSWDIVNQTTTSTGNSAAQTPAGLSPNKMAPYGNNILAVGDINGPVSSVDEDWVLFESTDGGTNFTPIYTHTDSGSYVRDFVCEADGTDPFIAAIYSQNPKFVYSFDSGATWSELTNSSPFTFYSSTPKVAYTDGYLWIMESRNYSSGRKSWILPANQTVISDANNWAPYEVSESTLQWHTNSIKQLAAHGQNGIIQHGNFNYYKTTDRGQTWQQITSITTTDNVTYNATDIYQWYYGLDVNPYTGEFKVQIGTSNSFLLTTDFVTWRTITYDPADVDGDNDGSLDIIAVHPARNGNWYALIRDEYQAKPRLFNLSESLSTSPPTIDRLIDSWKVEKEYDVVTGSVTRKPYYILKDYDQPDGINRVYIARNSGVDIFPAVPAPTIENGSTVPEIIKPIFTDSANLVYDVEPGYVRQATYSSNLPFSIVYVKQQGNIVKLDGIFNITVWSICEPVIITTEPNQVINYGSSTDILATSEAYVSWGFDPQAAANINILPTQSIYNTLNREDVIKVNNGKVLEDQFTYKTDYAIPIPTTYSWNGVETYNPIREYGKHIIFFPPADDVHINIVGLGVYADTFGTPYPNGYYWADNLIDYLGYYGSGTGWWKDIENSNYLQIKDGLVVEVGLTRNLPDYDQC